MGFKDKDFNFPDPTKWRKVGGHFGRWERGNFIGGSGQYWWSVTEVERIYDDESKPVH